MITLDLPPTLFMFFKTISKLPSGIIVMNNFVKNVYFIYLSNTFRNDDFSKINFSLSLPRLMRGFPGLSNQHQHHDSHHHHSLHHTDCHSHLHHQQEGGEPEHQHRLPDLQEIKLLPPRPTQHHPSAD